MKVGGHLPPPHNLAREQMACEQQCCPDHVEETSSYCDYFPAAFAPLLSQVQWLIYQVFCMLHNRIKHNRTMFFSNLYTQLSQRSKLQRKQLNRLFPLDLILPTTGQWELEQAKGGPWLAGHNLNLARQRGHLKTTETSAYSDSDPSTLNLNLILLLSGDFILFKMSLLSSAHFCWCVPCLQELMVTLLTQR